MTLEMKLGKHPCCKRISVPLLNVTHTGSNPVLTTKIKFMIKYYYVFKTYYGELMIAPIGHKSYYEWTIFGFTFKTKVKKIIY